MSADVERRCPDRPWQKIGRQFERATRPISPDDPDRPVTVRAEVLRVLVKSVKVWHQVCMQAECPQLDAVREAEAALGGEGCE